MTIKMKTIFTLAIVLFVVFQGVSFAEEARLMIAPVEVKNGQAFVVPVTVGPVEQLAGVKLALQYNPNILIYEKSEKTESASSLMQVVNDQKPGKLIIVMAGAKGISGAKMELLRLHFKSAAGFKEKMVTKIQAVEIEMVSDQLKTIPCKLTEGEITLLPEMN